MKIPYSLRLCRRAGLTQLVLLFTLQAIHAGSATWNLDATGYWNAAANWTPATVPNGPDDIATFDFSNNPGVTIGPDTEVDSIVFASDATAFTISIGPHVFDDRSLTLSGGGIINNSMMVQNFVVEVNGTGDHGTINFVNSASAGNATTFTILGAVVTPAAPGLITFSDSSTAGGGTFMLQPGAVNHHGDFDHSGAQMNFNDDASAGEGTFIVSGGLEDNSLGGRLTFSTGATGDHGVFVNNGGTGPNAGGGLISFANHTSAGFGTYTNNGGGAAGAKGATLVFSTNATADQSILIANGGLAGGEGARIELQAGSDASLARIELFGNGELDIHSHNLPGATIGSLEGNGIVFLGGKRLSVGGTNRDTVFAGMIKDGVLNGKMGALTKVGSGTLTLSGVNIYTGGTTVEAGTLLVKTTNGSGTGTEAVQVNGGTFGGRSNITGAVTIGSGTGPGAFLAPGINGPGVLAIKNTLTFKADGTYNCDLNTITSKADQVTGKGVTIKSGAQFSLQPIANKRLANGTVFIAISNTSANPIAGTFANLPDGSTFTAGRNNFQVSYSGGDGNDLTLMVVP